MKEYDRAGMDSSQQLIERLFGGGLIILIPVHVGQAPEEGMVAHILCHLKIIGTVFSLRRTVVSYHILPGDLLIESFYVS